MMKPDSSKAMQEALQAAVSRLNSGGADSSAGSSEPLGLLMSVLPKLLQDNESSEELLEKLESLQKGDIGPLREQVLMLRKQCHRLLKSQEEVLAELREVKQQQAAVNRAVLALARNLERVELIHAPSPDEVEEADDAEDFDLGAERHPGGPARRAAVEGPTHVKRKVSRNPDRERP